MTTPTVTRLKARLDARRRWLQNEWFFKWHHIGRQQTIEIDTFDGSSAQFTGVAFWGTPRDYYWDIIVRGVRREIIEQFRWVEEEVTRYPPDIARLAIDESAGQLASFVRSVRREAIKKDRILRGDGINFPPENDAGRWDGTSDGDILKQADALKAALFPSNSEQTLTEKINAVWHDHRGLIGFSGLGLAVLTVIFGSIFDIIG